MHQYDISYFIFLFLFYKSMHIFGKSYGQHSEIVFPNLLPQWKTYGSENY